VVEVLDGGGVGVVVGVEHVADGVDLRKKLQNYFIAFTFKPSHWGSRYGGGGNVFFGAHASDIFFVINNKLTLRVMAVQKFKCDCAYLVEQRRSHAGPGSLPPSASATCKVSR
jgi:hypothetical protein